MPTSNGWQHENCQSSQHAEHHPDPKPIEFNGTNGPTHPADVQGRREHPVPPDYENVARWQEDVDTRLVSGLGYRSRSAVYSPSQDVLPRLGDDPPYPGIHSRMYSPAQDSGVALPYMHGNGAPPRTPVPYLDPTREYGYSPTQEQAEMQYQRASGAMYSPDHNDSGCSIRLCGSSNSKGTSPSLSGKFEPSSSIGLNDI